LALDYSGDNASELKKVLEYFELIGDSEAYVAAEYIVGNMPGHRSLFGEYEDYYDNVDSLFDAGLSSEDAYDVIKRVSDSYGRRICYDFDCRRITSDYLIRDIESALNQWREGEWAKHLSFEEFCEWLLPYTCSRTQPLDNWRNNLEPFAKGFLEELNVCDDYKGNPRAAICRVNDILIGMIEKQKWMHISYGFPISRPETFIKLPGATCEEYAEVAVRIMRSKGIPVGIDFTPQWPDRLYGHYWCVFPNLRGKTSLFNPFSTNPDYPHYSHAEFAKVYRRTYAPNDEYLRLLRRRGGDVPAIFSDPFFKDVTEEYMRTADVEVDLLDDVRLSGRDVYIAVFDNNDWKPVFWGTRRLGKAYFEGMGRRITYIVLGYSEGELVPASHPFYLDADGVIHEFRMDGAEAKSIRMWRKYPMFQHVFKVHDVLHGGYVEASDREDFVGAERVADFSEWSLTSGIEEVSQSRPYRYWRLCAGEGECCDMAELFFYTDSVNRVLPFSESSLVDGDPLTNYSADGNKLNGYLDFGKPVLVDRISYVRRGDGNAIIPGDSYEILYWDESARWTLHSSHIATDVYFDIDGLPSGTLYYIRGLSRGVQHRIFSVSADTNEIEWR
jgi:hypothetical protein